MTRATEDRQPAGEERESGSGSVAALARHSQLCAQQPDRFIN